MSDSIREFEVVQENFKLYQEDSSYKDLQERPIYFDSERDLAAVSLVDPEEIIKQVSDISKKQLYFSNIYESQKRVLQTIEDEYERWYAQKYCELDNEYEDIPQKGGDLVRAKIKRSDKQKEMLLISRFNEEYIYFQDAIKQEKYKLGLIAGVKRSLDSFSYKLHAIRDYAKNLDV